MVTPSSIPSPSLTPAYLVAPGVKVPEAPISGRLALVVPGHEGGWIESIQFSSDLRTHQLDFLADDLHSERKVREISRR